MDNEFLLTDRLTKIKSVINEYGEENFYISFSGGKDSTVLSALIDMDIPDNKIPRVYANTGIELNMIRDFVLDLAKSDSRIEVLKPSKPIKQVLESDGYPFKSKVFSIYVNRYRRLGNTKSIQVYTGRHPKKWHAKNSCPKSLLYLFSEDYKPTIPISAKCCDRLKKEPLHNYEKLHNRPYRIIGVMQAEGGGRQNAQCLAFTNGKLKAFQPLAPVTKDWEEWFIQAYNIRICDIYKPPYNFDRTGCKGCPFYSYGQNTKNTTDYK